MEQPENENADLAGRSRVNPYQPVGGYNEQADLPTSISVPLAIVLLAVIVGLYFLSPGLGISAFILSLPAYVRAAAQSKLRVADGSELSVARRILSFLTSLAVVGISGIAGCFLCFMTCMGSGLALDNAGALDGGDNGIAILAIVVLAFAGFVIGCFISYRAFWPKR